LSLICDKNLTEKTEEFEAILARLGIQAATALSKAYPNIDSIGADIGVSKHFNPWIIEIYTNPDP